MRRPSSSSPPDFTVAGQVLLMIVGVIVVILVAYAANLDVSLAVLLPLGLLLGVIGRFSLNAVSNYLEKRAESRPLPKTRAETHTRQMPSKARSATEFLGESSSNDRKTGKAYLEVARAIYEDAKRLSFFWSAQTRPDRGQDFLDRITACVAEAMLAGRDIAAPGFDREVLHKVNRQFFDEENCRFRSAFVGWAVWPTIVASVARAVPEAFRETDESDQPLTEQAVAVEAARWACDRLPELLEYPTWGQAVFDFKRVAPQELAQHLATFASTFAEDRKRKRIAQRAAADAARGASLPPDAEPAASRNVTEAERSRLAAERAEQQMTCERLDVERPRRQKLRNDIELTYIEHASDVAGYFAPADLEQLIRTRLADDQPLEAIEAVAATFPTLMLKLAAKQRLTTFFEQNAAEIEPHYSSRLFGEYVATNLAPELELSEVLDAETRMRGTLQTLLDKRDQQKTTSSVQQTARHIERETEGIELVASAVEEIATFDPEKKKALVALALSSADRKKRAVVEDLVKKELPNGDTNLSRPQ